MKPRMWRTRIGLLLGFLIWLGLRLGLAPAQATRAMLAYWQEPASGFDPARWAVRDTLNVARYPVDRYRSALTNPWSHRACLLIVHGLTPDGKDDPRLVRFAVYLAHAGLYVWVPDLRELRQFRLDPGVLDGLRELFRRADDACPNWGLLAISVGAGPALSVLWSSGPYRHLRAVAVFGGYADACSLLAIGLGGERAYGWTPAAVRRQLRQVIERWALRHHWDPATRRAFLRGLTAATTPTAARDLCRRAPSDLRAFLARVSPVQHLPRRLPAPHYLVHAEADPAIPVQESRDLYARLRGRGPVRLITIPMPIHVEAGPLGDVRTVWSLARAGLSFFFQLHI